MPHGQTRLFIETSNVGMNAQAHCSETLLLSTVHAHLEQIGIHFLDGQEKGPKGHRLRPIDDIWAIVR